MYPKPVKLLMLIVWKKPPDSWVKLNTDGGLSSIFNLVATAGVIRNSEGRVLGGFQIFLRNKTIFVTELTAIFLCLKWCKQKNLSKV